MLNEIKQDAQTRMAKSIEALRQNLVKVRTGRASTALVEHLKVNYYGSDMPLSQVASITVTDARSLTITPWEKNMVGPIEKAILASDLGLTPSSDGKLVRLVLPPLSEEQRKKISGKVKEISEASRVVLRNARRDANKTADAAKKAGTLTEDLNADLHDEVQEHLKKREAEVDEILKNKTTEIMED